MSQDSSLLRLLNADLCAMGCRVFCVRDFDQLVDLVRRESSRGFVLVSLGDEPLSPAELRDTLAERLPGWAILGGGDAART